MASRYGYKLTQVASNDLDGILAHIANNLHAPDSAVALLDETISAIEAACDFPESHPLHDDPFLALRGYRKIVVKNYVVLYRIETQGSIIIIARIVYDRQSYAKDI